MQGSASLSIRVQRAHSPEPAQQKVFQAVDVIDRAPEPAVPVARMQVVHSHKHSSLAGWLPVVRNPREVLVVWGRQARPGNVGGSIGQLCSAAQPDLCGSLHNTYGANDSAPSFLERAGQCCARQRTQ